MKFLPAIMLYKSVADSPVPMVREMVDFPMDGDIPTAEDSNHGDEALTKGELVDKEGSVKMLRRIQALYFDLNVTVIPTIAPTRAQEQAERAGMTQETYDALPLCATNYGTNVSAIRLQQQRDDCSGASCNTCTALCAIDQCRNPFDGIVTGLASTKGLSREVFSLIVFASTVYAPHLQW